jgi:hypothetical protein
MAGGTIFLYCHRAGISFVSPPTTKFIHPQEIYFSWDWVRKFVGGYRVPVTLGRVEDDVSGTVNIS